MSDLKAEMHQNRILQTPMLSLQRFPRPPREKEKKEEERGRREMGSGEPPLCVGIGSPNC